MRILILLLAIGTLFVGETLPGRATAMLDRTTRGQDVTVSVTSPFSDLPPSGCVPYKVTIVNDRSGAGSWHLFFQAASNSSSLGANVFEENLTVAPNSTGIFNLLIPLPVVAADNGGTSLNIGVTGPGFNSSLGNQFFAYVYTNNTGTRSPFTLIGKDVLGATGSGPLEASFKDAGESFYGSVVGVENLPSDWRAYSGVAAFFLKDTEWLSLNPTQREAICDFVSQGGHLTLFTAENPDSRAPDLQLPEPDGKPGPYGFGSISLLSFDTYPPDTFALRSAMGKGHSESAEKTDENFASWGLRKLLGKIAVNGLFIFLFVMLFGSLVGPVNLFVFARGKKRFRLFWTTPLISILASLALMAGILLTDGIGGYGKQMIAIFSLPAFNREAVIQEQVARTAVLFSSHWRSEQNYLITPVSNQSIEGLTSTGPYYYRNARADLSDSVETFHQEGNEFSGNWFRSRSVTGQYLQAVRPSRSALTMIKPSASPAGTIFTPQPADPDEGPVILSSFPDELTKVFICDQDGNYWSCDDLDPGRQQTCRHRSAYEFNLFWEDVCANAGGKLNPLLRAASDRKGFFYATGIPSSSDILNTLGEIRWQAVQGVYLGPWVASPNPEAGP